MGENISAPSIARQQCRFWTGEDPVISVTVMGQTESNSRKAKPTEADKAAAARLRDLWSQAAAQRRGGITLTQDVAAEALGSSQSAVSQYLRGLIPLNYRAVLIFAKLLNVDPRLIRDDLPEQRIDSRVSEPVPDYGDWLDITAYRQQVGLGGGSEVQEYAETHKLKFRSDSLRRKGLRPPSLAVYYGHGDSMEPRIKAGDAVLFDTSDTRPADGAIFIVESKGEIHAKRCETIGSHVYFRSDNAPGAGSWRKPRLMDDPERPVSIVGRVRWIGSWED